MPNSTDVRSRARRMLMTVPALLLACGAERPQVPLHPDDRSPHRVGHVEVTDGVRLEYLDWGGEGEPLVFLAGLGNTAHVFDAFAPRFTDRFRVVGITRRGFGGSDRPSTGYDTGTLVADLKATLDSLGIGRVILAAHSIAGAEAHAFASAYPERVRGVVFLDSADFGCDEPKQPSVPTLPSGRKVAGLFMADPFMEPLPVADRVSAVTEHEGRIRRLGWSPPIGELLAQRGEQPEGSREAAELPGGPFMAVLKGRERCLPTLPVPALLVRVSEPESRWAAVDDQGQRIEITAEEHQQLQQKWAREREQVGERFTRQVPRGQVAAIPRAHHMIFLSHPDQTVRAMHEFLGAAR